MVVRGYRRVGETDIGQENERAYELETYEVLRRQIQNPVTD
jgi:hypothetical protein